MMTMASVLYRRQVLLLLPTRPTTLGTEVTRLRRLHATANVLLLLLKCMRLRHRKGCFCVSLLLARDVLYDYYANVLTRWLCGWFGRTCTIRCNGVTSTLTVALTAPVRMHS